MLTLPQEEIASNQKDEMKIDKPSIKVANPYLMNEEERFDAQMKLVSNLKGKDSEKWRKRQLLRNTLDQGDQVEFGAQFHVNTHKNSDFNPKVKEYLKSLLEDEFNSYCIDCKKEKPTFCLINYGTFVCKECVRKHRVHFGNSTPGSINVYIKPIFSSEWDDFQLSSVTSGFGGNTPMFNFLKEYGLDEETDIYQRYSSRALKWYKANHLSYMQGKVFTESKPIKDFKEITDRFSTAIQDLQIGANDREDYAKIGDKIKGFWSKVTAKKEEEVHFDPMIEEYKHELLPEDQIQEAGSQLENAPSDF